MEFAAKLKELEESNKGFERANKKRRNDPTIVSEPMFPSTLPASSPGDIYTGKRL